MKPVSELLTIAAAGGGLRLDASGYSLNDLVSIASAASRHGAKITFLNALSTLPTNDLVMIAHAGKGAVSFES